MCNFKIKKIANQLVYFVLAAMFISSILCCHNINKVFAEDETSKQYSKEIGNIDYGENHFEQWVTADGLNFGIIAKDGIIEKGSTLKVELLSRTKDEKRYNEILSGLDKDKKEKVEQNNIELLDITLTKPDGTKYTKLKESADLYIEVPDGWDWREMQAVYLNMFDVDQDFNENYVSLSMKDDDSYTIEEELAHNFIRIPVTNLAPYAIYDEATVWDKLENYAWLIGAGVIVAAIIFVGVKRRKKESE